MSSGDLTPNDLDRVKPTSNEVHIALVIARMIETVKNTPELVDSRQCVERIVATNGTFCTNCRKP
jgi:hypothetical protein